MESPLLVSRDDSGFNEDYSAVSNMTELKNVVRKETVNTWRIAGPVIFQVVCQYGNSSITTIFVGHLGELQLSAIAISLNVIATFAFGFMYGMGSAVETLCGQAFGAGRVHMLGVYMQRSWIVMFVCCILITPIYIFASPILIALGQQKEVAHLAGRFSILAIPQLFSFAVAFPTQKFLQAQSKVGVLAWMGFASLVFQMLLLWLFLYVFSWGLTGAALALDITGWALSIAQLVYCIFWFPEAWTGLSWLAFKDLWAFFKLSIASAVMISLEVWYMMSIMLLTGHLNNSVIAVDSLSVCLNMNGWESIIFLGMNAAMSVRVSNELGMGRPRAAKYSVYVTVTQCLLLGIVFMVLIILLRTHFAVIFTDSVAVQQYASKLAYLLGVTMLLNSVQPVISGVAVGGGWQGLVAFINLGSYYVFGLPFGLLLGYKFNLGVMGLWGGMITGTLLQTLVLLVVLYKTNWKKEVEDAIKRIGEKSGENKDIN